MHKNIRKYGVLIAVLIAFVGLVWGALKVVVVILLRPYIEQLAEKHNLRADALLEYLPLLLVTLAVIGLITIVYWIGFASGRLAAPSGYARRRYWGELWPRRLPFRAKYDNRPPYIETQQTYETPGGELINSFSLRLELTLQKRSPCAISGVWHKLPNQGIPGSRVRVFEPDDGIVLPEGSAWVILASGYSIGEKSYSLSNHKKITKETEETYRGHVEKGMWIEDKSGGKKRTIALGESALIQLAINSDGNVPVYYLIEIVNDAELPYVKVLEEGLVPYKEPK